MDKIQALNKALDDATSAVGLVGNLLHESGVQNPSAHVSRVGTALANLFEIQAAICLERPDLAPEQQVASPGVEGFSRELGDLLIQNQSFLAKNDPLGAIANVHRFLSHGPPGDLRAIAEGEEARIRGLFNV